MKYADDMLLAKEEMVLQGMIDKLVETGRCYGVEMNVEKINIMRISKQPFPFQIMIETTGGYGIHSTLGVPCDRSITSSKASSDACFFNFQCHLVSLRSSSSCLRLPYLTITSIPPFIFSLIMI
jgi:hypothetical protein